jgi:UrcA family protein
MNTNVKTHLPLALTTALLLASLWGAPGAFADEQVRSERVKFPDLNVDTPEGVQTLYSRIHSAAKHVCSESDPILRQAVNTCISKAEANAIEKLNLSQLTAYYKIKTKAGERVSPLVAAR